MRIGVYLGIEGDPTDNVVEDLRGIGRCLSNHKLDAFGTAPLPDSIQKYYNHVPTTSRSPRTPYTRIVATYRDCCEYINQHSPDVIFQAWKYQTQAPGLSLAGTYKNIPTITRLSGDVFNEYHGHSGLMKAGIFLLDNVFARIPMWASDSMIVFGPYGASEAKSRGMNPDDIVTIPPPGKLDNRFSSPDDKDACKKNLGLPTDVTVALYVGRLSQLKGMEFISNVINRVQNEQDILFVFAGKGPYSDHFTTHFSDEVVRLAGYVPHDEIHKYYQAADIYLHPSPYEGLPLVLLEAMNCGVPIISRPAGDIAFLTSNIARSPSEMANLILSEDWSTEWLNEEYFSTEYQTEALQNLVEDVT